MRLLARLMSHGFAIGLVVLLAFGFVYRGELFPEWELPDFLVFDSAGTAGEDRLTEKTETAPVQDDWMASGTTTPDQDVSEVPDETASTGDASGEMPPVADVAEPGTEAISERATAAANEPEESAWAGAPAVPGHDEVVPPADEAMAVMAEPAGTEASAEPVADNVQEPAESMPATTGHGDIADPVIPGQAGSDTVVDIAAEATGDAGGASTEVPAVAIDPTRTVTDLPEAAVADETGTAELLSVSESTPSGVAAIASGETPVLTDAGVQHPAPLPLADTTVSSYQLLASAREAYWMRNYRSAEDYYQQVISRDPHNPDGYGELANMYFSQGNWEAAASAYYEAGIRLVRSGHLAPAMELVGVIRGLDGPQADALKQEIQNIQAGFK